MIFALLAYATAMVAANLLVASFGPSITPVLAFFLIGLDLALRDWLHVRIRPMEMLALILFAGGLSYVLNPVAGQIALASWGAFTAAALADWAVFTWLRGSFLLRSNGSNIVGAAVDSLLFPTIAFGSFMPWIVALQFVAKVAGGAIWAWLLSQRCASAPLLPRNERSTT